jgi:uncharacterized ferritin-like protein (DUF455 family)
VSDPGAPPPGTVERWAWDYVGSVDLGHKLAPPAPPRAWEEGAPARRIAAPGRPPELAPSTKKLRTPGPVALQKPERRAELLHTFLHHELQAAELMGWAILAFPEAPRAFKAGLLSIARDEIRHMAIYEERLRALGSRFGAFPVRDWFWFRVPAAESPAAFVATMGMGFEGANLDHARRFADRFRAAGDEAGALAQEQVFEEEIPHVRFALHWFRAFTGRDDFPGWEATLTAPLTPLVVRGSAIQREARLRAGLSPAFVDELERWQPGAPGR